jgi:hypothetical protein
MSDVEYHVLPGQGTDGDNCLVVVAPDGTVLPVVYINPHKPIEDEVAQALNPMPPPAPQVLVPYVQFEDRWEPGELELLFDLEKSDWRVRRFINRATVQGHINLTGIDDPESTSMAKAAKGLFVELGVLSAQRADVIFAIP